MHPNEKVMRDADDAQMRGDVEAFLGAMTDDVVAHISGNNPLAGDHRGRDDFAKLFQRFSELVPEYSFEPHAYLADDEHGVSLQRSSWKRGDRSFSTNDAFVCHIRDGKIAEFWLLSDDEAAIDDFLNG